MGEIAIEKIDMKEMRVIKTIGLQMSIIEWSLQCQ